MHVDSSGTALILMPPINCSETVLGEMKEKGDRYTPDNTVDGNKCWGLVESITGSVCLWNFLSHPVSARSRVNKLPELSNRFDSFLLLIDSP